MVKKAKERFLQPVKLDFFHLFWMRRVSSSMEDFVPCDRLLKKDLFEQPGGKNQITTYPY